MKKFICVFSNLTGQDTEFGNYQITIRQIEMKRCKKKNEKQRKTEISFFKQIAPNQKLVVKSERDQIDKTVNETVWDIFQEPGIVMSFIRIVFEIRQDVKKKKIDEEEEDFDPDIFVPDNFVPAGSRPSMVFL